jgi:chromosome segregation ATPase
MENITRKSGENFHKRMGTARSNHLNYSSTGSQFYLQGNKSETYQTLIQMLKSDLIKIQDMINTNSGDIKMYKILSKSPGLTKKLSEIDEIKSINNYIEKINEDSKNIDKISKIYNCKDQELIQKLYLELSYNELLLKKINDYLILMKIKVFKDDTYQETLSKIIPLHSFMEHAGNVSPSTGDLNEKIIKLSIDNDNLKKKINEQNNQTSNANDNMKELDAKNNEIKKLNEEIEKLEKKIKKNENEKNVFQTEIKINGYDDLKKVLEQYEKNIKKERGEFNKNISDEIKELNNKINKLEEENSILNDEKNNLEKNLEEFRGRKIDQDSFENILREQFQEMKEAFKEKINDLNDELNDIKQETRVKMYQMEEDLKQSNYLKNIFLEQISSLQTQLENKS